MRFANRQSAGRQLADVLKRLKGKDTIVLALPRGGVVLGVEISEELQAPLGVVLVRKIGHPAYQEYGIGAVVEGEPPIYNQSEAEAISKEWLQGAEKAARQLNERRHHMYYDDDLKPLDMDGKVVIVVDDGVATGLTMRAAIQAVYNQHPQRIVVAIPVAPWDSLKALEGIADEVIVLDNPENFLGAVGAHYLEFHQVSDEEVRELLREANHEVRQETPSTNA